MIFSKCLILTLIFVLMILRVPGFDFFRLLLILSTKTETRIVAFCVFKYIYLHRMDKSEARSFSLSKGFAFSAEKVGGILIVCLPGVVTLDNESFSETKMWDTKNMFGGT